MDGSDKFNKNNDGTGKENTNGAQKEPQEYINFGEEDQMEIAGYERSTSKTVITWAFIILSAGLLRLVSRLHVTRLACMGKLKAGRLV